MDGARPTRVTRSTVNGCMKDLRDIKNANIRNGKE